MDSLFTIVFFAAAMWLGQKMADSVDIRNYRDKPFCEETNVAGTKVKKCLKAVEVAPEEK